MIGSGGRGGRRANAVPNPLDSRFRGNDGVEIGNGGAEIGNGGAEIGNHGVEIGNHGVEIGNHGVEIRNGGAIIIPFGLMSTRASAALRAGRPRSHVREFATASPSRERKSRAIASYRFWNI